jgi:hypothetical protein
MKVEPGAAIGVMILPVGRIAPPSNSPTGSVIPEEPPEGEVLPANATEVKSVASPKISRDHLPIILIVTLRFFDLSRTFAGKLHLGPIAPLKALRNLDIIYLLSLNLLKLLLQHPLILLGLGVSKISLKDPPI